jgi:hypothetical protein
VEARRVVSPLGNQSQGGEIATSDWQFWRKVKETTGARSLLVDGISATALLVS